VKQEGSINMANTSQSGNFFARYKMALVAVAAAIVGASFGWLPEFIFSILKKQAAAAIAREYGGYISMLVFGVLSVVLAVWKSRDKITEFHERELHRPGLSAGIAGFSIVAAGLVVAFLIGEIPTARPRGHDAAAGSFPETLPSLSLFVDMSVPPPKETVHDLFPREPHPQITPEPLEMAVEHFVAQLPLDPQPEIEAAPVLRLAVRPKRISR
jgi:hypothetical protein